MSKMREEELPFQSRCHAEDGLIVIVRDYCVADTIASIYHPIRWYMEVFYGRAGQQAARRIRRE